MPLTVCDMHHHVVCLQVLDLCRCDGGCEGPAGEQRRDEGPHLPGVTMTGVFERDASTQE